MWNKNVQTFLGCDSAFAQAELVLFGAPFDGTTSFRPGTRFGSAAMRAESFGIETYSPYQDRDLEEVAVFDGGDLELPFGNPARALEEIRCYAAAVYAAGKRPILLGGEHLVTLGAVQAALEAYPDLRILHFDAHADLRADYLGERLSHACVMRRIWELLGDGRLYQFGIRSGERAEFQFALEHTRLTKFTLEGLDEVVRELGDAPVYLTLDLDVLDPSLFSGTGTPEAGGLSFRALLEGLLKLRRLRLVGCDLNELSPHYDASGVSTATACTLLRELILIMGRT